MTPGKAEHRRKAIVTDLGDALGEAETLLKQAAAETDDRASDLRSQAAAKLSAAKSRLPELLDEAVARAKAAGGATDDHVRDNPWQVVGAAAAAGLLLGLLISRG